MSMGASLAAATLTMKGERIMLWVLGFLSGGAMVGAAWVYWSIRQQNAWHRRYMRAWKKARRQWRREAPMPMEL